MKTERRLLGYLRPYRGLFLLGLLATSVSSVLDGFTIVVLIPLFKHLFGTAGGLTAGGTFRRAVSITRGERHRG